MAAAISEEFLRPMPRNSIQATIGMVIPAAIASNACVGYCTVTWSRS
jgi:hypothetical protein